jgi:hypothetical protein
MKSRTVIVICAVATLLLGVLPGLLLNTVDALAGFIN